MKWLFIFSFFLFASTAWGFNVDKIAKETFKKYDVPVEYSKSVLKKAKVMDKVKQFVERVANSPEKVFKFYNFLPLFLNKQRVNDAVAFYKKHKGIFDKVYNKYGVDRCVLLAILSIETDLGRVKPKTPALDALYTLSIYSKRKRYFTHELEGFLAYTYKYHKDPFKIKGSMTAALGIPQFMPTSILNYAVDFNGNGLNLNELSDALASISNYLLKNGYKPHKKIAEYISDNISKCKSLKNRTAVFEFKNGKRCFILHKNFVALRRYNGTINYAMACYLLSKAICKKLSNSLQ